MGLEKKDTQRFAVAARNTLRGTFGILEPEAEIAEMAEPRWLREKVVARLQQSTSASAKTCIEEAMIPMDDLVASIGEEMKVELWPLRGCVEYYRQEFLKNYYKRKRQYATVLRASRMKIMRNISSMSRKMPSMSVGRR